MKKLRILLSVFLSCAILSTGFFGCSQDVPEEDDPLAEVVNDETLEKKEDDKKKDDKKEDNKDEKKDDKKTDAQQEQTEQEQQTENEQQGNQQQQGNSSQTLPATTANTTLQALIDSASAGSTVTLTAGATCTGTHITVSKALTINGNNLEGLTVKVSSAVSSNVTIRNLKSAKIQVTTVSTNSANRAIRRSRAVYSVADIETTDEDGSVQKIEKFGDGVLPLKLEGCEVDEFIAEKPVALYLETGSEKSSIEELKIWDGADNFTIIEKDDGVASADKSSVEKLFVEKSEVEDNGVQEINLIGCTFGDVDFADDFTAQDKLKFKYDAEFDDQFEDKAFMEETFVKEKDVALADYEATAGGSGIYKFTMPRAEFNRLNGYLGVVFLTDAQKQAIQNCGEDITDTWLSATYEHPMYDMSLMGSFKVFDADSGTGLKPIYGRNESFLDYSSAIWGSGWGGFITKVWLTEYMHYSKEAAIFNVGTENVELYVNTNAITKEDLSIHVGMEIEGIQDGCAEGGTKLTKLDLTGYKPYLIINTGVFDQSSGISGNLAYELLYGISDTSGYTFNSDNTLNPLPDTTLSFLSSWLNSRVIFFPCTSDQKSDLGYPDYYIFPMTQTTEAYPTVSSVTVPTHEITRDRITVKYYDANKTYLYEDTDVVKLNVNPYSSPYEYYYDSEFKYKLVRGEGDIQELFDWNFNPTTISGYTGTANNVYYAIPKRTITFWTPQVDYTANPSQPTQYVMRVDESLNINLVNFTNVGKNCRGITYKSYNATTKEFSNLVTDPSQLSDGDTVYIKDASVTIYAAKAGSTPELLGTKRVFDLPIYSSDARQYYSTSDLSGTAMTRDQLKACNGDVVYSSFGFRIDNEPDTVLDFITIRDNMANGTKYYNSSVYTDQTAADADALTLSDLKDILLILLNNNGTTQTIFSQNYLYFQTSQGGDSGSVGDDQQ